MLTEQLKSIQLIGKLGGKKQKLCRQGDFQAAVDALKNAVGCSTGIEQQETLGLLNSTQSALAQQSKPTSAQGNQIQAPNSIARPTSATLTTAQQATTKPI